jgi:hypothetical protein
MHNREDRSTLSDMTDTQGLAPASDDQPDPPPPQRKTISFPDALVHGAIGSGWDGSGR